MKFEINDLEGYIDGLDSTLGAFDLIWPEFEKRGITKDAAFTGWCVLCLIDFMNCALTDDDREDWQL